MSWDLVESVKNQANIKVIGVGGGGGNAVHHMIQSGVDGVEFICTNTDAQALDGAERTTILQIGTEITKGLGAGADPSVGRSAALEDKELIESALKGADMVFITAGMGGGTGTGAAPIIAQIAKDLGILTIAVVSRPFRFEGKKRKAFADEGIRELHQYVDSLITIPNDKLMTVLPKDVQVLDAFAAVDNVLKGAVQGIADLIYRPGYINVDFADVRTVMREMGMAMMGTGVATGADRARKAAEEAIRSPLLEDINLEGARGILVNISAGTDLGLAEFADVGEAVEEFAADDASVVIGTVLDPDMGEEIKVTVVATGLVDTRQSNLPLPERRTAGATAEQGQAQARPGFENQGIDYGQYNSPAIGRTGQPPVFGQDNGHQSAGQAAHGYYDQTAPQARQDQHAGQAPDVPVFEATSNPDAPNADKTATDYLDVPAFVRRMAN